MCAAFRALNLIPFFNGPKQCGQSGDYTIMCMCMCVKDKKGRWRECVRVCVAE